MQTADLHAGIWAGAALPVGLLLISCCRLPVVSCAAAACFDRRAQRTWSKLSCRVSKSSVIRDAVTADVLDHWARRYTRSRQYRMKPAHEVTSLSYLQGLAD